VGSLKPSRSTGFSGAVCGDFQEIFPRVELFSFNLPETPRRVLWTT
jgi:hypothetical protein